MLSRARRPTLWFPGNKNNSEKSGGGLTAWGAPLRPLLPGPSSKECRAQLSHPIPSAQLSESSSCTVYAFVTGLHVHVYHPHRHSLQISSRYEGHTIGCDGLTGSGIMSFEPPAGGSCDSLWSPPSAGLSTSHLHKTGSMSTSQAGRSGQEGGVTHLRRVACLAAARLTPSPRLEISE